MFLTRATLAVMCLSWCAQRSVAAWVAADSPPTRFVQYVIYDDVNAPNRQIAWRVALELHAAESDGDAIGWAVDELQIREDDASPRTWIVAAPDVDTPDGLWWVTHADPDNPQLQEFDMPPFIGGTATAENEAALAYEMAGVAYTAPAGGPHFASVAALDLRFLLEGEPNPVVQRWEEPVMIIEYPMPPMSY